MCYFWVSHKLRVKGAVWLAEAWRKEALHINKGTAHPRCRARGTRSGCTLVHPCKGMAHPRCRAKGTRSVFTLKHPCKGIAHLRGRARETRSVFTLLCPCAHNTQQKLLKEKTVFFGCNFKRFQPILMEEIEWNWSGCGCGACGGGCPCHCRPRELRVSFKGP